MQAGAGRRGWGRQRFAAHSTALTAIVATVFEGAAQSDGRAGFRGGCQHGGGLRLRARLTAPTRSSEWPARWRPWRQPQHRARTVPQPREPVPARPLGEDRPLELQAGPSCWRSSAGRAGCAPSGRPGCCPAPGRRQARLSRRRRAPPSTRRAQPSWVRARARQGFPTTRPRAAPAIQEHQPGRCEPTPDRVGTGVPRGAEAFRGIGTIRGYPPRNIPCLNEAALDEVREERVKSSRGRRNQRGVKRKMSAYPLKRRQPPLPPIPDIKKHIKTLS